MQQVVALEEAAALAGDIEGLQELYGGNDSVWWAAYLHRAENGQAAPQPMALLQPLPGLGTIVAIEFLAPDSARAEVQRKFIAPDGSRVAFRLSQFYRRSGDSWKRIPPPSGIPAACVRS